jgi:hypothetical protein
MSNFITPTLPAPFLNIYNQSKQLVQPNIPVDSNDIIPYAIAFADYELQQTKLTYDLIKKAKNLDKSIETFVDTPSSGSIGSSSNESVDQGPFRISSRLVPDVDTYVNTFNDSVALLDDPFNRNKYAFNMYLKLQDDKLDSMKNEIEEIESKILPDNVGQISNQIKSIKNIESSILLNVEEYTHNGLSTSKNPSPIVASPTNNNNGNNGNNSDNCPTLDNTSSNYYLIYGNHGCLSYNPANSNPVSTNPNQNSRNNLNNQQGSNKLDYGFRPCNANDPAQKFYINKVPNVCTYNNLVSHDLYKLKSSTSQKYGFNVVTPRSDSKKCLTTTAAGLTIQPCTLDNSQKFKQFYTNSID